MATPKHLQRAKPQYEEFSIEGDQAAPAAMYRASSRPAVRVNYTQPASTVLIDRKSIDKSVPVAKAIASAACWVNSGITTVLTVADIQVFITDRPSNWIAWVSGLTIAVALTFGQIYTSGRHRKGYFFCLFPDACMTAMQWCSFLLLPLCLKLFPAWVLAVIVAALIGGIIGIVSARLPEQLTIGIRE